MFSFLFVILGGTVYNTASKFFNAHIWDRLVLVTSLRGQPIEVAMVSFLQLGLW